MVGISTVRQPNILPRSAISSLHWSLPVPIGNNVTCTNNSSYPIMGVCKIIMTTANGSSFTLPYTLFVLGIKKKLLSVLALAKIVLVVKFVDDRCTVHDLSNGDVMIASGVLCHVLYKLIDYERFINYSRCAIHDSYLYFRCKGLACTLWSSKFCKFALPVEICNGCTPCPNLRHLRSMSMKGVF